MIVICRVMILLIPIAEQCREVRFTEEMTRRLVNFQLVGFRGKLYSKEYKERTLNGNSREEPAGERKIQAVH